MTCRRLIVGGVTKIGGKKMNLKALMEKREVVLEELLKIFDEVLLDLRTR